jgi:hypothetical protein
MWVKDVLIIDGVCHAGELIRRYRCIAPSIPVSASSNAVLIQLQGKDRYGKLQAITLMRCYRANVRGNQVEIDIRIPSNILQSRENRVLHEFLKSQYPNAYVKAETQAVLALCKVFEG